MVAKKGKHDIIGDIFAALMPPLLRSKPMNRKRFLISSAAGLVLGLAAALITHRSQGFAETMSNTFFFGGIILLVAALGSLTVHLGFYDAARYGFKRLAASRGENDEEINKKKKELGDYDDFIKENKRGSVKKELFLASAVQLVLSLILAFSVLS